MVHGETRREDAGLVLGSSVGTSERNQSGIKGRDDDETQSAGSLRNDDSSWKGPRTGSEKGCNERTSDSE